MENDVPPISFETNVKPLFSSRDISCMKNVGVLLDDVTYMSDASGDGAYFDFANARHVLARLSGTETPRMPKGGPFWSDQQIKVFSDWIQQGAKP